MTNENDLIRRGDALNICTRFPYLEVIADAITALPAGATSQPANPVVKADSCQRTDVEEIFMSAVWGALKADANDLHKQRRILEAFRCAIDTQPDPRDAVIARLVEAAEKAAAFIENLGFSENTVPTLHAAIAAAKGGAA